MVVFVVDAAIVDVEAVAVCAENVAELRQLAARTDLCADDGGFW